MGKTIEEPSSRSTKWRVSLNQIPHLVKEKLMIGSCGGLGNVMLVLSIVKTFTTSLLKRFHDEEEDELYTKFGHIKQKGNANDFTHEWEVLATRQIGF
jgi:hypothetical protein